MNQGKVVGESKAGVVLQRNNVGLRCDVQHSFFWFSRHQQRAKVIG